MPDNIYIYIYEKSQFNSLVSGSLTLTPITLARFNVDDIATDEIG